MTFDMSLYETLPQTTVPGTLALIRATITAGRGIALPTAKKALKRVRETGEALRSVYQAVPTTRAESTARVADQAMDRICNAIDQRLTAWFEVGGDEGAEAARVHGIMFPNGMGFLSFKYPEQWAEGEAIVSRIESERLTPSLEKLVGAPFLRVFLERHVAYGESLGITKAKQAEPDATSLVEPLRVARAALSTYMRVVVAAVDNGDFDAEAATKALAPIASLRESIRSSKKKGGAPVPPPPVSPEPLPSVD